MRFNICLAALAATLATTPAFAQQAPTASDTAAATAKGVVLQAHKLEKSSDLDFGVVTVDSVKSGSVTISAEQTPSRTTGGAGGVTVLPSSYTSATFNGLAAPAETVKLTLEQPGFLISTTNNNDKIGAVLALDSSGDTRVTDNTGEFTVYVGGTFNLAAGQNSGVYTAQFNLTADYQ